MKLLRQVCDTAMSAGLTRVLVGGSFVSTRQMPMDLDGVLYGPKTARWDWLTPYIWDPEVRGAGRCTPRASFLVATNEGQLAAQTQLLSCDRNGQERGLVEVVLQPPSVNLVLRDVGAEQEVIGVLSRQVSAKAKDFVGKERGSALDKVLDELKETAKDTDTLAFLWQCLSQELSRPAAEGEGDVQVNSVIGHVEILTSPTRLVDYGCGSGRLISGLATLDSRSLKYLDYIGVDFDTRDAYQVAQLQLSSKCRKVVFSVPDNLDALATSADLLIMLNVLHEVPLRLIGQTFSKALSLIKPGGRICIGDMSELVWGERCFVPWTGQEVCELLGCEESEECRIRQLTSRNGVPLFYLWCSLSGVHYTSASDIDARAGEIYRKKQARCIMARRSLAPEVKNVKELAYLNAVIANISDQLLEPEGRHGDKSICSGCGL